MGLVNRELNLGGLIMEGSEIIMMLFVYSGLILYFLIPFQKKVNLRNQQHSKSAFKTVYKHSLRKMLFHKKAIFAFILLGFTLFMIWSGYAAGESHYNNHSGYPPINTNLERVFSMFGLLIYTVLLLLLLVFVRTIKIVQSARRNLNEEKTII